MAIDRKGVEAKPGDLVEIYGRAMSGKRVVAVADSGVYVIDHDFFGASRYRFLKDSDRCFTTLGPEL